MRFQQVLRKAFNVCGIDLEILAEFTILLRIIADKGGCIVTKVPTKCRVVLKSDLPHFRCRVKLRLKHPKVALALLEARNLPAHTSAA